MKKIEKIEVYYDGAWPAACMGRLVIKKDGIVIYNKKYCCHSTDGADWDNLGHGRIVWSDADEFDQDVQEAVRAVLDGIPACCGGCI